MNLEKPQHSQEQEVVTGWKYEKYVLASVQETPWTGGDHACRRNNLKMSLLAQPKCTLGLKSQHQLSFSGKDAAAVALANKSP